MFFRREKPRQTTFDDRLEALRRAGFDVQPEPQASGRAARVVRDGCAAVIAEGPGGSALIRTRPGVLIHGEIAALVDGGFQKFFMTPGGIRRPALAAELKAVHNFQEDLREALGLETLYNEAMGTVSNLYLYDRLEGRDRGTPRRAWEL